MVCATLDLLQHARFNVEQWVMRKAERGGQCHMSHRWWAAWHSMTGAARMVHRGDA